MALLGNTTSLNTIIAKVYRDFNLKDEEEYYNFIEWGVEALEQIGVFEQLETITDYEIDINYYRAEVPSGLVQINMVSYNGFPLKPSSNFFGPIKVSEYDSTAYTGLSINIKKVMNNTTFEAGIDKLKENTYSISNGYFKLPYEAGKILISYQSLPVDCDGLPTVPDDISFREAVYRYIVYKYLYPKWVTGQVNQAVYQDAEQKWQWYCGQAGAKAQMPDLAKLESIARNYISLKPNVYKFSNFFENINKW